MPLPYESATSGERALGEIQKILRGFGCDEFGSMMNDREGFLLVQFKYRGREVSVKASIRGYAAAWLAKNPPVIHQTDIRSGKDKTKREERLRKANDIASTAVYSILRDWIKGQVAAIETGVLSFDAVFMAQTMLPGKGVTMIEFAEKSKLLPALEAPR
jgi:hypothetical protein